MAPSAPEAKTKPSRGHVALNAARALGLTPRIFDALVKTSEGHFEAIPSSYVPSISQHVNVRYRGDQWCQVVVEEEAGARHVLHVDPLHVRKLRDEVRAELQDVQDRRGRCTRRIKHIRQNLPKVHPCVIAERLEKEIKEAEVRATESLVQPLPSKASQLFVFLEASPRMVQLDLVCQRLAAELPYAMEAAGTAMLTLVAVGCKCQKQAEDFPRTLELRDVPSIEGRQALCDWLQGLVAVAQPVIPDSGVQAKKGKGKKNNFFLADALRRAATADALGRGGGAALLVVCTPPTDMEACEAVMRRSKLVLQVQGVLGASAQDPEPPLEHLVEGAAPGSQLHLWFGQAYWDKFAEARRRQLDYMRATNPQFQRESADNSILESMKMTGEVVSSDMLEIRLLERIMRECYVDEQRCEEELTCLNSVLANTLTDPEEIKEAMKPSKDDGAEAFLQLEKMAQLALQSGT